MTKRYVLFLSLLFSLGIYTPLLAQQTAIEGTVTDEESDQPLPGINIEVEEMNQGTATDSEGKFRITDLDPGSYLLTFSGVGFTTTSKKVDVKIDEPVHLEVALQEDRFSLDEVVVSATRGVETIDEVPASVSTISRKNLSDQSRLNANVNDMLAQQVPGFAQSTQSASNWGQTLRGRNMLVLVDGIPQSTPLRNVSRDLLAIDAEALERVEVVKGATAIYGNGAEGGLVNYITRQPEGNDFQSSTKLNSSSSLVSPSNSMGYRLSQSISGSADDLQYHVNGSYEQVGRYKDAEGDVIPVDPHGQGGLSEADIYNLFTKLNYNISDSRSVTLMYNLYSSDQETDFVTVPGSYPDEKATAEEGNPEGEPTGTRANHNLSFGYADQGFIGKTALDTKVFMQSYETVFAWYSGFRDGGQSYLDAEKYGARINLNTPFVLSSSVEGSITYGMDLLNDVTAQPLLDGRTFTPQMDMFNTAPFVQIKALVADDWVLKGGLRLENIHIDVDDYVTVEQLNPSTGDYYGGVEVDGGSLDYNAFTWNLGLSYKSNERFNPFASISQGFSVADLGRSLNSTTESTTVQNINPEEVIVQNYEVGLNSSFNSFRGSLAGFVSTSDLGSSYQQNEEGELVIARSPEIVYGVEASTDIRINEKFGIGGSFTFTEGRTDDNDNGSFTDPEDDFMVNNRIAPPKLTSYAEYQINSSWDARINLLHSLPRDRFTANEEGQFTAYKTNVDPYTTLDLSTSYQLPFGEFSAGITNLLNADYYPAISQWAGAAYPTGYAKGQGARFTTTLTINL